MTTETVYRFRCDAPQCPSVAFGGGKGRETPEGWTELSSAAHLSGWQSGQRYRRPTGRSAVDTRTLWDVTSGRFILHLCPAHSEAFDDHRPKTEGGHADRKTGDRNVSVSCSCGWSSRLVRDLLLVHGRPEPHAATELAWWRHLPTDLQWYATREVAA